MAHYCHVIYACYQNMTQNLFAFVNLRQITLLRGYIQTNEQTRIYLYHKCFFSLHIDDFTYIAHAQKRLPPPERF